MSSKANYLLQYKRSTLTAAGLDGDDCRFFLVRESIPPDVERCPVADVEEDEEEGENDQKYEIGSAVVVWLWAYPCRRPVLAGVPVAVELHLAGVPFPSAPSTKTAKLFLL